MKTKAVTIAVEVAAQFGKHFSRKPTSEPDQDHVKYPYLSFVGLRDAVKAANCKDKYDYEKRDVWVADQHGNLPDN
jgi:hypothetical protein